MHTTCLRPPLSSIYGIYVLLNITAAGKVDKAFFSFAFSTFPLQLHYVAVRPEKSESWPSPCIEIREQSRAKNHRAG